MRGSVSWASSLLTLSPSPYSSLLTLSPSPHHQEERKLGLEPEPAVLCGTLEIVRHLVQRLGTTLDTARVHAILSAAVGLVSAPSFRVRLSMTQLIGALATRGYLCSEVGSPLLLFLIRQAAVPAEDALEGRRRSGETVGALETRSVAAKTLELLARTVPPMRQVLWPMLLGALMNDEFVHAAPVVCDLLLRIGASLAADSQNETSEHIHGVVPGLAGLTAPLGVNDSPKSAALFARLFLCACTLEWMPLLAERSLQVMLLLAAQLHPAFVRLWGNHIPKLLGYLHTSAPHLWAPETAPGGGSFEAGVPAATGSSAVSGTCSSAAASGVGGRYGPLPDEWAQLCLHFLGDTLDVSVHYGAHYGAHDGAPTDSTGSVVGDSAVMGGSAVVGGGAGEGREASAWVVQLGHETLVMLAGGGAFPHPLKAAALALLGPVLARTPFEEALPVRLRSMLAACNECGGIVSGAGVIGGGGTSSLGSGGGGAAAAELDMCDFEAGGVRLGCAIGMGGASATHFDLVVDVVSGAMRELTAPPPTNMADFLLAQVSSMLKEQKPPQLVEIELATGLLCLGHSAARAPPRALELRANALVSTMLTTAKSGRSEALRGCAARAFELTSKVLLIASCLRLECVLIAVGCARISSNYL